jgi:type 1 fimbriae regulatory protein FimB
MGTSLNRQWKRTREYLTQEELRKLLAASQDSVNSRNPVRDYCMLLLMFRHGLRVSELCAMRLSDVNVATKELHVKRLKGCDSGPHELYNGESGAIKAWLLEREKMNPPADCDTLFISERRKRLSRCTVWVMIGRLAAAAGLDHLDIHPHMLRIRSGEQRNRYSDHSRVSRASIDLFDDQVHESGQQAVCETVLRFAFRS